MKPFLKVVLWICGICLGLPLILLLCGIVNSDDLVVFIFGIIGILGKLLTWLWNNIGIICLLLCIYFGISYFKNIHKVGEATKEILERHENKLNSDFDLLYQTFKRVNRLEEKIEKLEKQLKSKKATQK